MIHLEIKSIDSSDVNFGETRFEGPDEVYFAVCVTIGMKDDEAGDDFQVLVATPEALRKAGEHCGQTISTRGLIVVSEFSWQHIRRTLDDIVASCAATDWPGSVLKLQRYFHWEYEDFR